VEREVPTGIGFRLVMLVVVMVSAVVLVNVVAVNVALVSLVSVIVASVIAASVSVRAVRSALGLERRMKDGDGEPEPPDQVVQDVIVQVGETSQGDLDGDVTIAEMIRGPCQEQRILRNDA
jgi:hypothetical protein